MISAATKQRVETKINACIATIEKKYKVTFKKPAVHYNVRGTTAGKAWTKKWIVGFNAVLLNENTDDFIARTVPHEIAHLATELIYPHAHVRTRGTKRSPHGSEWASIMVVLGADVKRCHSYDTTNAQVKRSVSYDYKCACCGAAITLGPKRHAKMLKDPHQYTHTKCGRIHGKLIPATPKVEAPKAIKPVITVPKPVKTHAPAVGTKMAQCYRLFENYPGYSRAEMINVFVQEVGMTPAGAATYYANCKKLHG